MRLSLTDLTIQRLRFDKQTRVFDTQLPGFGILVSKNTKTFFVVTGKERKFTALGRYPGLSLKEARLAAKKLQTTQTTEKPRKTLPEAVLAFTEDVRGRIKPATLSQYLYYLEVLESFDDDIQAKLRTWEGKPWAMNYAFASFRLFFNWCVNNDYIDKSPLHGKLAPNKTRSRDRVLSDDELGRIWRCTEDDTYGRIIRLLILTGQRREEVRKLRPEDVTNVITFHTKGDKINTIPITPLIRENLVLPFNFNNWSVAKARFQTECGVEFRHHDLRRTLATKLAEFGVSFTVIERILGHSLPGVHHVYNRYSYAKEVEQALLTYGEHILKISQPGRQPEPSTAPTGVIDEDTEQARAEGQDHHLNPAHHQVGEGGQVPTTSPTDSEPGGVGGK